MAVEHDEFVAMKAIEKFPEKRLKELRQGIIDQAVKTGNMTVEVNYGGKTPIAFVKVERSVKSGGGTYNVTDRKAAAMFEESHVKHVTDINLDGIAGLNDDEYQELVDFISGRWPWLIIEEDRYPTFADCDHVGSSVVIRETGELWPGVEWDEGEPTYDYTVKAVEANKSGNPGTKAPKLESVAKSIGGSFAQLTSGEMFAIEGEVE